MTNKVNNLFLTKVKYGRLKILRFILENKTVNSNFKGEDLDI